MAPLAKRIVLKWMKDMDMKMAEVYHWGCPNCHRVYEKQTQAQACCLLRKTDEKDYRRVGLEKIELKPIGFYYESTEDYISMADAGKRWLDWSTRIVKTLKMSDRRKERMLRVITDFIEGFEEYDYDIAGWDHELLELGTYMCDKVDDYFSEFLTHNKHGEQTGKFGTQILCAVRSGLDTIVPYEMRSTGVAGFATMKTIRDMYPEGIPGWVAKTFKRPVDEIPDDENLWL